VGPALAVFAGARVFDVLVVAVVCRGPSRSYRPGDLGGALSSWDGEWYRLITNRGYPSGPGFAVVRHSALAFFPVYPGVVAAVRRVTGLGFVRSRWSWRWPLGPSPRRGSRCCSRPIWGGSAATRAGMVWACSPVSAVLVLTYSDGLFAAEAVVFLVLLVRERYRWLVPLVPVMALTRGVLAPFAAVVAVHLWRRRATLVTVARRFVAVLAVAGVVAASGLWPVVVAVRTGRMNAYLLIQESWQGHPVPLVPWVSGLVQFGSVRTSRESDVVILTAFVCAALALASLRIGLPVELGVAAPAQLAYLVLLLLPTSSFLRFTLPLVTLAAAPALWLRTRTAMTVALLGGLLIQLWWLQLHLPRLPTHIVPP